MRAKAIAAAKLSKAGQDFLTGQLWRDSPRGIPALAADVSYRPAKQISDAGLADRETDGAGSAWYYLNHRGWALRERLAEMAND